MTVVPFHEAADAASQAPPVMGAELQGEDARLRGPSLPSRASLCAEALRIGTEVLATVRGICGDDHIITFVAMDELAKAFYVVGNLDAAVAELRVMGGNAEVKLQCLN